MRKTLNTRFRIQCELEYFYEKYLTVLRKVQVRNFIKNGVKIDLKILKYQILFYQGKFSSLYTIIIIKIIDELTSSCQYQFTIT